MSSTIKWIDLRDQSTNGRLKVTTQTAADGRTRTYLFIVGMSAGTERWKRAIELLGFVPSPNQKYLVRAVAEGERITARMFSPVWPNAVLSEMEKSQVVLDLAANRKAREEQAPRSEEESSVAAEVGEVIRLGRNLDGDEVFQNTLGRYIVSDKGRVLESGSVLGSAMFLRVRETEDLARCADGFVQSMFIGEVQHSEDFDRFLRAVTDHEGPYSTDEKSQAVEAIESASLRQLERLYETANDAYGDSARLYEFMPPYQGEARGKGAMPLPLSVMAQRLLGDTAGKSVVYPRAFDGASFAFLADGTNIRAFRGGKDLSAHGSARQGVDWADAFVASREQTCDAMFINADPVLANEGRADYGEALVFLRILNSGGRAVVVLAADESEQPGQIGPLSRGFYDTLSRRYEIETAFEVPATMTDRVGTHRALRVVALRNRAPAQNAGMLVEFPVKYSWDEVKSHVDEVIHTIDLKEAESQSIDVERVVQENDFQRPYIAFSKVGEARTMVPKNLQAPLQEALATLETAEGPVDAFVERELGFGENTLGERFSPEQVDAIGLSVFRMKSGRAMIIGDETGIGKGRILSAMAVWAEKHGKSVIFITDRSNLFSDLARDLRDIEEWGRFKPLIMNADGVVMDLFKGEVLLEGTAPAEMRAIMENKRTIEQAGRNMVLATYSQISNEESDKAEWLLNQAENSLVIVDESHIAAGSDSNVSRVVIDLVTRAWACAYSSATWAKSSENLHIYSRALPEAINISSLTRTMKSGGEAFAEVFSGMLARDGALIRREHDLSKLEFGVEADRTRVDRNNEIADRMAEVLGAMTYVGGEITRLLMRSNNDTIAALKAAREARSSVVAANLAARQRRPRRGGAAAHAAAIQDETAAEPLPGHAAPQLAAGGARAPVATGQMFRSSFGAGTVLYQVMRRLLALLNVDNVADLALNAISEGRKPVIVFEETGESFVKSAMEAMTIPGIDGEKSIIPDAIAVPTIKDMLYKVVARMGAVVTYEVDETSAATARERADEEIDVESVLAGEGSTRRTVKVEQLPGLDEDSRQRYEEGMKRIVELIDRLPPLPLNAIDLLRARLEHAGLRVGEISGRRVALDVPAAHREALIDAEWDKLPAWSVRYRKKSKQDLNRTVYQFNHGELDAVLINRSAAAGISLHASPRFSDRRRRELIEMQIPENPTDRIQLYGRVNRYDQLVGPKIAVASTGIFGETRQLMMQNKKLARLSANTRSSRENAAEIKHVVDLLNPVGEAVCRKFLEDNGGIRQRLGITESEMEASAFNAAAKLTSRLVLLKVAEQKMVYEELYEAFDEEGIRLDLAGENPLRAKEMDIRAKTLQERIAIGVEMDGLGSAFDGPVFIKEVEWREERKPIEWADLRARAVVGRRKLVEAAQARFVEQEGAPELAHVSEIDWESDVWIAGRKLNDEARKEAEARAILTAPLPDKVPVVKAILEAYGLPPPVEAIRPPGPAFARADIERLTEVFRATQGIETPIDISVMTRRLAKILEAKSRIELVGTKYASLDEALAAQEGNGIKRVWARKLWVEQRMKDLVPGAVMTVPLASEAGNGATPASLEGFGQLSGMVTSVTPPARDKEAQLQRWKVEWVVPGDEKPRVASLASLLDRVVMDVDSETRRIEAVGGPILSDGFDGVKSHVQIAFERVPRGSRRRTGHLLDGNMYLASEWAQATKNGFGVVYTDERGVRHRAVMLKERILGGQTDVFSHLPVRLWNRQMLAGMVRRLWAADNEIPEQSTVAGYVMPTDFKSAMNQHGTGSRSELVVKPGAHVALTMERTDLARISRALRSEVAALAKRRYPNYATMSAEERKAVDATLPKVATSAKRGHRPGVVIKTATEEEAVFAVEVLCRSVGLEVYLWPHSRIGQVAQEIVTDYFTERREAARAQRDQQRRLHGETLPAEGAPQDLHAARELMRA